MAMKKCPECGEKYSDTYKRCPFCDEEQKLRKGKRVQKRNMKNGGRRAGTSDKENILTLILLVIMLVLAGILLWLLFGGGSEDTPPAGGSSQISSEIPGGSTSGTGADTPGTSSGTGTGEGTGAPQMPEDKTPTAEDIKALPETLTLSKDDMTLNAGTTWTLKIGDGTGTYTWVSANPNIATVDPNGKVTAVANGNVYVYATDGSGMGKCIVRVKGGSAPAAGGTTGGGSTGGTSGGSTGTTNVDASKAALNKSDVTIEVGEFLALKVKNFDGEVTWSVEDPSIASVLNDGSVKALKKGRTNVIATVGDRTLKCIVRVTNPQN